MVVAAVGLAVSVLLLVCVLLNLKLSDLILELFSQGHSDLANNDVELEDRAKAGRTATKIHCSQLSKEHFDGQVRAFQLFHEETFHRNVLCFTGSPSSGSGLGKLSPSSRHPVKSRPFTR